MYIGTEGKAPKGCNRREDIVATFSVPASDWPACGNGFPAHNEVLVFVAEN